MIVADTSAWIAFLRRPTSADGQQMDALLAEGEVAITGVVLAEVLRGARNESDFDHLAGVLMALPFLETSLPTWRTVGELSYELRRAGRMVPLSDLIVAAVAREHNCAIYTLDEHFQRIPGVALHEVGG